MKGDAMSIRTVHIVCCDGCKTEEEQDILYRDVPATECEKILCEQYDEDGWLIDQFSAFCPDCRVEEERYRRADAQYPSLV